MNRSRADLLAMQNSIQPMTDQEHLEFLREFRKEQMRLAKSWKGAVGFSDIIWKSHLKNAEAAHLEIKVLKLQIAYAKIDQVVGEEPIRSTDYDDLAGNFSET